MAEDTLALPQSSDPSDTLKHGTRYPAAVQDGAYLLWRTVCGRSARKTAQRTGINEATIHRWIIAHEWIARANHDDSDDYQSSRHGVAAVVVTELVKSLEVVTAIRDNPDASNKDRLTAAFWLAGLAGVSPVSKIEQAVTDNRQPHPDVIPDFSAMSPDELRAYDESLRKQIKRKTNTATVPQTSHHQ